MKKFVLGLITGLVLTAMVIVVLVFSAIRLGDRKPLVPSDATLVLRISGEIPEKSGLSIPLPVIGTESRPTVHDYWLLFRKAAADKRVRAVLLMPQGVSAGWGKLDELRAGIAEVRRAGKPVYAYLRRPGTREYYLAAAADRIYMSQEDVLNMKGLRAEMMFLRGTLDKVGVQVEIEHAGKYKNAGDMFTETGITPETREVMDTVLDSLYGHMLSTIAQSRRKTPEQVRAAMDEGPFLAERARDLGLIDGIQYEDEVLGLIKSRLNQKDIRKVTEAEYVRVPGGDVGLGGRKRIAFIVGEGTIMTGGGSANEGFNSEPFIRMLRQVSNDDSISAAVLRVDSPGGDAIASDEILREVQLLRKKKPLVISMSDSAASGGYYVAMTGDPIVAYPNTYTGSIGVIYGKANLRGLYDKLGIRKEFMTRGRNAAMDTDYQPLTPDGRAKLRQFIDATYRTFVSKAAASRRVSYDKLAPLAEGRVWLGSQAKANGLIDEVGGIDRAVELAKQRARIAAGDKVTLVPYPPKRSIFEAWMQAQNSESAFEARLRQYLGPLDYRLWQNGGIMRLMPYRLVIE